MRIERTLNELQGVEATVNYATERATVDYDQGRAAVDDLIHAVEAAGYRASIEARVAADDTAARRLLTRLLVAAVLTVPLVVLAMVPPLQFDGWEWLAAALATPVVLCDAAGGRGGTWSPDGTTIVFAPAGAGPLQKVASAGGVPTRASSLDGGYAFLASGFDDPSPGGRAGQKRRAKARPSARPRSC